MNILITGGAGYIGSHFINKLLKKDDIQILVIDNFSQGKNNVIINSRIKYHEIDLRDKEAVLNIFTENKIDIVAHFAALASVPDSVSNPNDYYENNLVGGYNLLNAIVKTNVKMIINSSSASVYGEPIMEEMDEDHSKKPTNPYGYTKLVFENMLEDYNLAYGLNSISFRYFCAAGCDESGIIGEHHNPETHVIPSLLKTLSGERESFYVFGDDYPTKDGSGVRDYIHVNDLADAHILAIDKLINSESFCESYNLGINKGFSVLELIKAAEDVSGQKLNYEIRNRRSGDPSKLIANATKAQTQLNWTPKYIDIKGIIATAYNFFNKK